jgi:hypothetical protein
MIVKMIVEKQMKCRLAGETEVLGENLPHRHFCHHKIYVSNVTGCVLDVKGSVTGMLQLFLGGEDTFHLLLIYLK